MARGRSEWLDEEREGYPYRRRYSDEETGSYSDEESPWGREYRTSRYDRIGRQARGYSEREYGRPEEHKRWGRPGPYVGRGPKGYRRSDERIIEEINERLTEHGEIDARDIEVEVRDAVVILKGTVQSREMKHRSEEVAEVSGVQNITNELRVKESGSYQAQEPQFERRFGDRGAIRPGMQVIDRTGDTVGTVKEIRSGYFVVDRRLEPDISVDLRAVTRVDDCVYINPDVPDRLTRRGDFPKV